MRLENGKALDAIPASFALIGAQHQMLFAMRRRLGGAVERTRAEAALERTDAGVFADMIAQTLSG